MNSDVRRTFEMTGRVIQHNDAEPDDDPGQAVSAGRLQQVEAQMREVAALQRAGVIDVRTGAAAKRRLRREVLAGPVTHVVEVGGMAKREDPDLANRLRFKPADDSYVGTFTAARGLYGEALAHKEVLTKYGLSESVLELFGQMLDEFDAAVKLGSEGRAKHVGATRQLAALAVEAGRIVRAMDARNRHRWRNDPQRLGAWNAASTVIGRSIGLGSAGSEAPVQAPTPTPASEESRTPEAGGDVRPAA